MDERATLRSHLEQSTSQTPHGAAVQSDRGHCRRGDRTCRPHRGWTAGRHHRTNGGINSDGDQQKEIDVLADEIMRSALRNAPVAAILSEEVALA